MCHAYYIRIVCERVYLKIPNTYVHFSRLRYIYTHSIKCVLDLRILCTYCYVCMNVLLLRFIKKKKKKKKSSNFNLKEVD